MHLYKWGKYLVTASSAASIAFDLMSVGGQDAVALELLCARLGEPERIADGATVSAQFELPLLFTPPLAATIETLGGDRVRVTALAASWCGRLGLGHVLEHWSVTGEVAMGGRRKLSAVRRWRHE